jgi:hypothetical protein
MVFNTNRSHFSKYRETLILKIDLYLRIILFYYNMATTAPLPLVSTSSNVAIEGKKDELTGNLHHTEVKLNKKKPLRRVIGNYNRILVTRKQSVDIVNIGSNIKQTLEKILARNTEGKCVTEGFIKPNSVNILTYSSGIIMGNKIVFDIAFECDVCSPVEGMHINCISKNITKAGIRAETDENPSPMVIFIARDHHNTSKYFTDIKSEQNIKVKIIGQRFELNDKYISVIAELIEPREDKIKKKKKPKIVIKDE